MIQGIWDQFLKIVKEEAGSRVVETWFKAVTLYEWDSIRSIVYLQAPNSFVKDWILGNYNELVQHHLKRLLNVETLKVVFLDFTNENIEKKLTDTTNKKTELVPAVLDKPKHALLKRLQSKNRGSFNVSYQFETFVVGPSNSLASAAAQAITENPGELYNPLFIYGGSGLGKTHLLHAIGNGIRARNKKAMVLYQTADRFVNEFISAIRFNKVHKFQAKYKNIDVLLIDDIQFISNKEQTQEAFFHIFNSLYDSHKQIVFSSDTFPQNIDGIAERLRSRLAWGLVTDIHVPSLETKVAILKRKADLHEEFLDDEVAHFIAMRVDSNIRELEGALVRVMAFSSLTNQPVSIELAKKVLLRVSDSTGMGVNFKQVIKCISNFYPYSLHDLCSKKRNRNLSFARHVAMFLMKKTTDKSLREIGSFLGGRDHSTVVHALNKVEKYSETNPAFLDQLRRMERAIRK
ncbi:chromosomal replication initiator protein DnaA [bacterium]|nr:chromosomal replication initiator protein DnaA [bacterium]